MKKKISLIVLIALVALLLAFTQVFAFAGPAVKPTARPGDPGVTQEGQGPANKGGPAGKHTGRKFHFSGTVTSVSATLLELTDKSGASVKIALDASTVIKIPGKNDTAALQAGDKVAVQATRLADQSYLALRVMLVPGKPQRLHRVGEVTAYQPGVSITIRDSKGETTFTIAPDVKILPAERAADLKVGARVTIISPRQPAGGTPIAKGIVIHPARPAN